jgi:DNA-binding beta-propeller fold protein YncE
MIATLVLAGLSLDRATFAADDSGAQQSRLNGPKDVVADRQGNLYMADSGNGLILYCNPTLPPDQRTQVILRGLNQPTGLALDAPRGILYVAETGRNQILCRTSDTAVRRCAFGFLNQPMGLDVDEATGNLYIADSGNNRLLCLTPRGAICQVPMDMLERPLNGPRGVAVALGDLFIADTGNNRILRRDLGCGPSAVSIVPVVVTVPPFSLNRPADLAAGAGGLYIADTCNNRVLQIDIAGITLPVAGVGPIGCGRGGYSGDGGLAILALLNAPEGISYSSGTLFIADTGNDVIRQVNPLGIIDTADCP